MRDKLDIEKINYKLDEIELYLNKSIDNLKDAIEELKNVQDFVSKYSINTSFCAIPATINYLLMDIDNIKTSTSKLRKSASIIRRYGA